MGIKIRCFLDNIQVQEPINYRDMQLSVPRDPLTHGIQIEASTMAFSFIGDAYAYLKQVRKTKGLKAKVNCVIEQSCFEGSDTWERVVDGRLNISQWKETAGTSCMVSFPIEEDSCTVTLNNKINQQVDVDDILAQDRVTPLNKYFGLGLNMEVPTKVLDYKTEGYVADEGDVEPSAFSDTTSSAFLLLRPDYENKIAENINQSALTGTSTLGFTADGGIFIPITPQVLYNEANPKCFSNSFKVNGRLKGTINLPNATQVYVNFMLKRGEINPSLVLDIVNDVRHLYADGGAPGIDNPVGLTFDWSFSEYEWNPVNIGSEGLYLMMAVLVHDDATGNITFDKESFFKAETLKACPPTQTKVYLIHEIVSRIVESITSDCVRFKSEYYGRRDSEPFDFPIDGCGGLRFLTSGLKLRNAANPTFFASLQDILLGLQAIDNIGMGIEEDPDRPGCLLMRWEDLDFFYRNEEIMRCPGVTKVQSSYNLNKIWSTIQVGYEKWETQANFGLDEYNSNREFRTAIDSVNSILKITSKLVAGEYPIELTRQQQYVDTSEADTTYDNETFIICLRRIAASGYPYGEMVVEQGNVNNPENIFSPSSVLNYGISPVRNLLRWFRSIAAGYPNISDSDNKLYFNSGTGNILAKGELSNIYGGTCRLENDELQENQDIAPTIFADILRATPLWRAETVQYDYPMSLKQYENFKLKPYGYISYQEGVGEWKKGYIDEITFKPFQGIANFKLIPTWK